MEIPEGVMEIVQYSTVLQRTALPALMRSANLSRMMRAMRVLTDLYKSERDSLVAQVHLSSTVLYCIMP